MRGVASRIVCVEGSGRRESQSLTARQDISVVAADVEGVKLGSSAFFHALRPSPHRGRRAGDLTQYAVNLRPAEMPEDSGFFMSQDFFGSERAGGPARQFEWKNVNPGTYIVQVYRRRRGRVAST